LISDLERFEYSGHRNHWQRQLPVGGQEWDWRNNEPKCRAQGGAGGSKSFSINFWKFLAKLHRVNEMLVDI